MSGQGRNRKSIHRFLYSNRASDYSKGRSDYLNCRAYSAQSDRVLDKGCVQARSRVAAIPKGTFSRLAAAIMPRAVQGIEIIGQGS